MDRITPITLFHLSFRDFLIDSEFQSENQFWVNVDEMHWNLGMHCIRLLESGTLRKDICKVQPGTRRADLAKSVVHTSLPEDVAYACCYWIRHIVKSGRHVEDAGAIHQFLEKHLLHWMEAMSWLGKASDVIHSLAAFRAVVDVSHKQICASNIKYLLVADRSTMGNNF
jgi:hypothetical protein